jgi:FMN phosphatase YigB (HAD superfamily)
MKVESPTLVVFDIGGVLIHLRHTWDEVLEFLGEPPLPRATPWRTADYAPLNAYQDGSLSEDGYLSQLGADLRISRAQAAQAHAATLGPEYDGVGDLVKELKEAGVQTACLSNTNELHWRTLIDPRCYPAIASLDQRFASFELRVNKPLPAAYHAVEPAFPSVPRRIFFDDALANVDGAIAVGWKAFRIDPHGNPVEQMRAALTDLGIGAQ